MAADIWSYFRQKEAELRERCNAPPDAAVCEAEPGSGGMRGKVNATIHLTDDAHLSLYESVVINDGSAHRELYAYRLIVDGVHEIGWDRDPRHPEQEQHEHIGPEEKRVPGKRMTFPEVLERVWEILSSREQAPWSYED